MGDTTVSGRGDTALGRGDALLQLDEAEPLRPLLLVELWKVLLFCVSRFHRGTSFSGRWKQDAGRAFGPSTPASGKQADKAPPASRNCQGRPWHPTPRSNPTRP